MAQTKTDLERAYDALTLKGALYSVLYAYYDGDAPVRYVTDRLREVFQDQFARFTQNWAAVVIDAELERLNLTEFDIATPEPIEAPLPGQPVSEPAVNPAQQRLNDLYVQTELKLDADDVHTDLLVTGEAFVFAWRNEVAVEAYRNDPRLCHVFYDEENPRRVSFAAKWWIGSDGKRYLNLYYAERIEYYVSSGLAENVSSAKAFERILGEVENPFGRVPIFHFRLERRIVKGRLANVIEMQDAINKLFQDMMVAAEFGAFKQRYIISSANVGTLKNAPNEIWDLPAADGEGQPTSAGEFSATELNNYIVGMDKLATNIAIITRTPKYYFFGQGGDPSGESLIAMEAPLNKKVQSTIDRAKPVWAQVGAFMLMLDGIETPADMITPVFKRPETVQPMTEAQIWQTQVNAGIPLETALRRSGWTEEELAELRRDKQAAQQQAMEQIGQGDVDNALNRVRDLIGSGQQQEQLNGATAPA